MSLVVIPVDLPGARAPVSASVMHELCKILFMHEDADEESRERQPFMIVPLHCKPWRHHKLEWLVDQGVLFIGEEDDEEGDEPFVKRLDRAIGQALGMLALGDPEEDGSDPFVIVAPVVVTSNAEETAQEIYSPEAVKEIYEDLVKEVEGIAWTPGGGEEASDESAFTFRNFQFLPWLFLPAGANGLDPVYLKGPASLGARQIQPIVQGGRTEVANAPLAWEGHGQARLLTDMCAIYALSSNLSEAGQFIPEGSQPAFRLVHSSFYEYPVEQMVQEAVRAKLREKDEMGRRRIPSVSELQHALTKEERDEVLQQARQEVDKISEVIEREKIPENALDMYRGPKPGCDEKAGPYLSGVTVDFSCKPEPEDLDGVGFFHRADGVHTRFFKALTRLTQAPMDRQFSDALTEAHDKIDEVTSEAETALSLQLVHIKKKEKKGEEGALAHPPAKGAARVTLMLDTMISELERLGQRLKAQKPKKTDKVLKEARQLRGRWLGEEKAIIQKGRTLPSELGVAFQSLLIGAGISGLIFVVLHLLGLAVRVPYWSIPIIALLAGVGTWLLSRYILHRAREKFFAQWDDLAIMMGNDANKECAKLVKITNQRICNIKYTATTNLLRGAVAARDRFMVELRGVAKVIDDRLTFLITRRSELKEMEERFPASLTGRFRMTMEKHASLLREQIGLGHEKLCEDLLSALEGTLTLQRIPSRTRISHYKGLVKAQVKKVLSSTEGLMEQLKEDADALFLKAVKHGADRSRLPCSPPTKQDDISMVRVLLAGYRLQPRLDVDVLDEALGTVEVHHRPKPGSVANHLPPEVAITMVIRTVPFSPSRPAKEGRHG